MKIKVLLSLLLALVWWLISTYAPLPITASIQAGQVASTLTADSYQQSQRILSANFPVREVSAILIIILLLLVWSPELKALGRRFGKQLGIAGALAALLLFGACRPVNIVTKEPNEALFKVPVVGSAENQSSVSNAQFETNVEVGFTQVEVDRSWVCTFSILGICTQGYYRPSSLVYVVNTTPVTVNWVTMADAIPVESAESGGFSVPIILTAYLTESDEVIAGTEPMNDGQGIVCKSAVTYLSMYGRKVDVENPEQVEVPARELRTVIDTEVRGAIAINLSARFAPIAIENAVAEKANALATMTHAIQERFAAQGVCISAIGSSSGLLYDDPAYQQQIDNAAARGLDESAARANATTIAINAGAAANSTQIAVQAVATQAEAEATAEIIAAQAEAQALRMKGEVIQNNPGLVAMEYAENNAGGCTSNCFGDTSGVLPVYNVNPQPTQPAP